MWEVKKNISPLSSSRRSRDKSGDVSRGDRDSSLPLADVVGELTLVGDLGSPPVCMVRVVRGHFI